MSALRFLAFPNARLTQINQRLLQSTSRLCYVDLGEKQGTITTISQYAFYGTRGRVSITVPESVTSIEQYAFGANYAVLEYHFKRTTPPTLANTNVFYSIPSDCIFYVPRGYLNTYKTATNWSQFSSKMQEEPT